MKNSFKIMGLLLLVTIVSCQEADQYATDGMSGATMKSKSNQAATVNSDWWPNQLNLSILR